MGMGTIYIPQRLIHLSARYSRGSHFIPEFARWRCIADIFLYLPELQLPVMIPNLLFPSYRTVKHLKTICHQPQQSMLFMASIMKCIILQRRPIDPLRIVNRFDRQLSAVVRQMARIIRIVVPAGSRQSCRRAFRTRGSSGKRRRRRLMNVSVRERRSWHVTSIGKGDSHRKEIEK